MQNRTETTHKAYIGNLSFQTTSEGLKVAFEDFGVVLDAVVMTDRETGRSRGFGFVTFETKEGLENALQGFEKKDQGMLDGRKIIVSVAKDKERSSAPRGGGAWRGGAGGGGGYRSAGSGNHNGSRDGQGGFANGRRRSSSGYADKPRRSFDED